MFHKTIITNKKAFVNRFKKLSIYFSKKKSERIPYKCEIISIEIYLKKRYNGISKLPVWAIGGNYFGLHERIRKSG